MYLCTRFRSRLAGADIYGNRYYRTSFCILGNKKERRWVLYQGFPEASKVPPEWHAWLHHTVDTPLITSKLWFWQQEHTHK